MLLVRDYVVCMKMMLLVRDDVACVKDDNMMLLVEMMLLV